MNTGSRVLTFEGIHNFRDYGGYAVSGGGRLRRGMLWRSGQHHEASDADLQRLTRLGLLSVFDLRSDSERESHPCRRPSKFAAQMFLAREPRAPDNAKVLSAAPHVAAAQKAQGRDAAGMRDLLRHSYSTIPFRPALLSSMRVYLAKLAKDSGPSLVHCMAGKDRTGFAVALLHRTVGVHPDDIMADYLLTNTAGDVEARIVSGGKVVVDRVGPIDSAALRVLLGVEPEYLDCAFAAIKEQYGDEDAYLAQALGADAALLDRLRERLVEA